MPKQRLLNYNIAEALHTTMIIMDMTIMTIMLYNPKDIIIITRLLFKR